MANDFTWKNRQKKLLQIVLDICKKSGIEIFLCGETALAAYRDGLLSDNITVAIETADATKFIEAVESYSDESIGVESMLNNGTYPNFDLRVFDRTTVDFNLNNCRKYRNNCIHIQVKFVEHLSLGGLPFAAGRVAFRKYKQNSRCADNTETSAALFRKLVSIGKGSSSKIRLGGVEHSICSIQKKTPVKADEIDCVIPADTNQYFTAEFGSDWEKHECSRFTEDDAHFRTAKFSWDEYASAIKDIDLDEYFRERDVFRKENSEFLKVQKTVQQYYDYMDRTYDRICLWEKYEPMKEQLMKYQRDGQTEKLKETLAPYIEKIEQYAEMDLGLCFDSEIFDMAYDVLISDGKEEVAEKARDIIPEQHKEPFVLKDYRGNPV